MLREMILISLACALPLVGAVEAQSASRHKQARQAGLAQRPPKDCTRYNSRYGFYGNIWCSPAEQRRWDLWDAARSRVR